jgi:hypothetical protein
LLAQSTIGLLRDELYRKNKQGDLLANVRAVTSGLQTGNPFTSAKVGISRFFYTVNNTGFVNTTKALFDVAANMRDRQDQARVLDLLGDQQHIEGEDLLGTSVSYDRAMRLSRTAIELGGHGVINRMANTVNLQAAKMWMDGAINDYRNDVAKPSGRLSVWTQDKAETIARRGMGLTIQDLVREADNPNGPQTMTRSFLRKFVTDTQTSYDIMDMPSWSKTPVGKLAFQYQHWAYNASRMLLKETVLPGIDHFAQGSKAAMEGRGEEASNHFQMAGLQLGRTLLWAASGGVIANEAQNLLQQLFGRNTMQVGLGDFLARLDKYQDGAKVFSAISHRAVDDIVNGSFMGMIGDYARTASDQSFRRARPCKHHSAFEPALLQARSHRKRLATVRSAFAQCPCAQGHRPRPSKPWLELY